MAGSLGTLLMKAKQERPYLRICKHCMGKGQLSYLDKYQRKTYGPCKHCSNPCGPYALGVAVKCRCQGPAVKYSFMFGSDVKQVKQWRKEQELVELNAFHKSLGKGGTALLIMCSDCGAQYLAQDGAGERRKISTVEELNESDKEYNRHIAATLVSNGIVREVGGAPGSTLPLPTRTSDRTSASTAATVDSLMSNNPLSQCTGEAASVASDPGDPTNSKPQHDNCLPVAEEANILLVSSPPVPTLPLTSAIDDAEDVALTSTPFSPRAQAPASPVKQPAMPLPPQSTRPDRTPRAAIPNVRRSIDNSAITFYSPQIPAGPNRAHNRIKMRTNSLFCEDEVPSTQESDEQQDNESLGNTEMTAPLPQPFTHLRPTRSALLPLSPISMA